MPCENCLGICRQQRLRSGCTLAQSDQGFHSLLTGLYRYTIEGINGEQMPE